MIAVRVLGTALSISALVSTIYRRVCERRDHRRFPAPGDLIEVGGGRRVHLWSMGDGPGPTVVVVPCLGGPGIDWAHVQRALADEMRVVLFDRPGIGWSDRGPWPQHAGTFTDDLVHALETAEVPTPYVLVAGSSGGFVARLFAARHPDRTAGLVLADCSHERQRKLLASRSYHPLRSSLRNGLMWLFSWTGIQRIRNNLRGDENPGNHVPPDLTAAANAVQSTRAHQRAAAQETLCWNLGARMVQAETQDLGDLPVAVITARGIDRGAKRAPWDHMQALQAATSTRAWRISAPEAGHHIHRDEPDLITATIRQIAQQD